MKIFEQFIFWRWLIIFPIVIVVAVPSAIFTLMAVVVEFLSDLIEDTFGPPIDKLLTWAEKK